MAGSAIDRKRIDDLVEALSHYNKSPFITEFLRQQPAPRISAAKYDKDELCAVIKQVLLGEYTGKRKYVLQADALLKYLDTLQETGRQHLYFFQFPDDHRDATIKLLRDPQQVKRIFGGDDEIYSAGRVIWESKAGPELAGVVHAHSLDGTPQKLLVKWVETREYWAPPKDALGAPTSDEESHDLDDTEVGSEVLIPSGEKQRIQVRVPHDERAVSFFIVDLQNGECQLRIQALHGHSRVARKEQQRAYRALISNLLKIELVGPTVLAPAIRRALLKREVPILRCAAILPNGGKFIGGRDELPPVDVRKLEAGVTIRFDWSQTSGGVGRVELDGRLDETFNLRPLLPENYDLLVAKIHEWRRDGLGAAPDESASTETTARSVDEAAAGATSATVQTEAWSPVFAALTRNLPAPIAIEPMIDRAIREYARTHQVDDGAPATGTEQSPSTLQAVTIAPDEKSLAQFLGYIKEVAQSEKLNYQREIKPVREEEQWMFRLSVIAAVLALLVVATGAVLIFASQTAIGTITSILGAVTGGGTVLIRSYAKNLKAKRESIQDQQRDSQQTLLAIQTALAISDATERARAMSGLTTTLLERIRS